MTLLEAIDAALDFVRNHPDEMTRPDVNTFEELGDDVYRLAMAANIVSALPQVPELRPELESQDPPLPSVQFVSKLHLPGDWDWPATEGDLDSAPAIGTDLPELPRATFLVSATPRWRRDMEVLRSLAMNPPTDEFLPPDSPSRCAKLLGVSLDTLKRWMKSEPPKIKIKILSPRRWQLRRTDVGKPGDGI
jgi:hypothetical protein